MSCLEFVTSVLSLTFLPFLSHSPLLQVRAGCMTACVPTVTT